MTVGGNLAMVAASIGLILALMLVVRRAATHFALAPETQRKIIHVVTGLYALTIPVMFKQTWPVFLLVMLSIATMMIMRLKRFAGDGVASVLHAVKRRSYGEIYLSLAIGFLFFRAQDQPVLYVLPILVLTLSDAAAALVGSAYGRKRFLVADGMKSLEGSIACFVVTWLIAMIALLLLADMEKINVVVLSFLVAAFGTLIEADSWRGLDNLFVPIGVHLLLATHLASDPTTLMILAAYFVAAIVGLLAAAPYLDLSAHSARVVIVLVFLIGTYSTLITAILPLIAVAAHLAARRFRPEDSPYPDLDFLAIAALVSLFWLFAGEQTSHSTVDLHELTFATAATMLLTLPLIRSWRLLAFPIAGAVTLITVWITRSDTADSLPAPVFVTIGTPIVLAAAIALLLPAFFDRRRSLKVFGLALLAPLLFFTLREVSR